MVLYLSLAFCTFQSASPISFEIGEVPSNLQLKNVRLEEAVREAQRWRRYALYGPEVADEVPISTKEAKYILVPGSRLNITIKNASADFSLNTGAMQGFSLRLDNNRNDSHLPVMPYSKALDLAKRYWRAAGMEMEDIRIDPAPKGFPGSTSDYEFFFRQEREGLSFSVPDGRLVLDMKRGTLVFLALNPQVHRVHPKWRDRVGLEEARRSAQAALARYDLRPVHLKSLRSTLYLGGPGYSRALNEMDDEQRECERRNVCIPTYAFIFTDANSFNPEYGVDMRMIAVQVDARSGRTMAILDHNALSGSRTGGVTLPTKPVWEKLNGKSITLNGKRLLPTTHVFPVNGSIEQKGSLPVSVTVGSDIYTVQYDRKADLLWHIGDDKTFIARPSAILSKALKKVHALPSFGGRSK